jgi:hypothetical protein
VCGIKCAAVCEVRAEPVAICKPAADEQVLAHRPTAAAGI